MKYVKFYSPFKNKYLINSLFFLLVFSIFFAEIEWFLLFFISKYSNPNILNLILFYLVITIVLKIIFDFIKLFLNNKRKKSFFITNIEYFLVTLLFVFYNIERKLKIDIIKKNLNLSLLIKFLLFLCIFSISIFFILKFITGLHKNIKRMLIISILIILLIPISINTINYLKISNNKHIILVSIDSLRPDHLSCYGYKKIQTKNIDDLAKSSFLFKNAYCQAPYTEASLSSISSGCYPFHTNVRNFGKNMNPKLKTIGQILLRKNFDCVIIGGPGYKSNTYEKGFRRIDIYSVSLEEFMRYRLTNFFRKKPIKDRTICALSYINNNSNKSYIIWIHYWDPHAPYHPPEAYIKSKTSTKVNGTVEQLINFYENNEKYSEDDLKYLINLYDSEVLYVDDNVGFLIQKYLKKKKNDIFILTADHGEALGEKGLFLHAKDLIEPMIKIPLIINCSWINKKPRSIGQIVSSIDIVPTILDLLLIEKTSFNFDGKSLLPLIEGNTNNHEGITYFETMGVTKIGIRDGKYKMTYNIKNGVKKLYVLNSKNKEKFIIDNSISAKLEKKLLNLLNISTLKNLKTFKEEKINDNLKKKLKSLGYIE